MSEESKSPVTLGDNLTTKDLHVMALELEQLIRSAGWKVLEQLVDSYRLRVGARGIRDLERPREYYIGLTDGVDAVFGKVRELVQQVKIDKEAAAQAGPDIAGRYGRGTVGNVTAEE